jgi:hypothetical protein
VGGQDDLRSRGALVIMGASSESASVSFLHEGPVMKAGRVVVLAAVALAATACHHQVIQTGRTPGPTVVHQPWTSTWIFGLVPAKPLDVTSQCPTGVATVETRRSFMNGLVGGLTLGIWTPIDIKVTCAAGRASLQGLDVINVARSATPEEREAAVIAAIELARETGKPVGLTY